MPEFGRKLVAEIPALRRYALALLRNPDRADDLVQDCLERAVAKRRLWDGEGSLRAWLFAMMHNVYANQVRGAARRPSAQSLDSVPETARGGNQLDAVTLAQVVKAFDRLSEEHRQVLYLVAVEGMAYREVARVLDLPIGTVMSRLARARERLRQTMEPDGPGLRRVK